MTIHDNTLIVIGGPTASGKTAIAIEVAKHFNTEIISADSRQCFSELKIGVARPSEEELQAVPHHFIASHSIHDTVNAGVFEKYALHKLNEIFSKSRHAVVVGGTGLYIKSLLEGFDDIPDIPIHIRENIIERFNKEGLQYLQSEIRMHDPEFFVKGESSNPQRLMRALEVMRATGKSLLSYRKQKVQGRPFNIIQFGISLSKERLHENISGRVDQMIEMGLVNEVKGLIPYKYLNALQTVGYKELFDFFEGGKSIEAAINEIKQNTRQYAKRQMTWFKKQNIQWISPDAKKIISLVEDN